MILAIALVAALSTPPEITIADYRDGTARVTFTDKTTGRVSAPSPDEVARVLASVKPASPVGVHTVAILVTSLADRAEATTPAQAMGVLAQASGHYQEGSFGATSLTGQAYPVRIAYTSAACDAGTVLAQAQAEAAKQGYAEANYNHTVVLFPGNCPWWGLATVTGGRVWIVDPFLLQPLGHEIGHNFGLLHSHSPGQEYGDSYDIMGYSVGPFNAFQKQRLGWLNPPAATLAGDYILDGYDLQTPGLKALYLPATPNVYFEYRNMEAPFDQFSGLLVHTGSPGDANSSNIIAKLAAGQSYTSPQGTVSVRSLGTQAVLAVSFPGPTTTASPSPRPTATPTPIPAACAGDTFDRANGPLGPNWIVSGGILSVYQNRASNNATAAATKNYAVMPACVGATSASATMTVLSDGGGFGVILGYRDRLNYWVGYRQTGGTSALRISRVVNGVESIISPWAALANPVRGVPFAVSFSANGSVLTFTSGGKTATAVDPTYRPGLPGIWINSRAVQAADNFN